MIPIVTPSEMAAIDAAAPEGADVLVARAGAAVAAAARQMMGGTYGRRVLVAAGKGNNGADGRVAAAALGRWGARCRVVIPAEASDLISVADSATSSQRWHAPWDLLIDAAYGTGLRGPWRTDAGPVPPAPVLAVDIPSGIDALTGADSGMLASGTPGEAALRESWPGFWQAEATVTFGALKPGLLLHPGASAAGEVHLAPIGLDCSAAEMWLLTDADAGLVLPTSAPTAHKWRHAVRVIAGSQQMRGAGHLVCAAAQQAGAGMVVASSPGSGAGEVARPAEAVGVDLLLGDWADAALDGIERFAAAVIGPGIGTDPATSAQAARFIERCPVPLVADADALAAVADHRDCLGTRSAPTVLTPHDGEFARLTGSLPAADRFDAVRVAARSLGAVVLLKGPTTLVASPEADGLFAAAVGNQRLATAGSGDVLSGIIAAMLAHHAPRAKPTGATGPVWPVCQPEALLQGGGGSRWCAIARDVAAAAYWHGRTAVSGQDDSDAVSGPLVASEQIRMLETARAALMNAARRGRAPR